MIEALCLEDRAYRIQTKIADYVKFGFPNIWTIDPETKTAVAYDRDGVIPVSEGSLRTANPEIELPLSELF